MRGFGVPLHARHAFESEFVPENPAGGLLHAEQAPLVRLLLGIRSAIAVETDFQLGLRAGSNCGCDVNPVFPDNRAGVAQAGKRCLPKEILAGSDVPRDCRGLGRHTTGMGSAELLPARGGRAVQSGACQRYDNTNREQQLESLGVHGRRIIVNMTATRLRISSNDVENLPASEEVDEP